MSPVCVGGEADEDPVGAREMACRSLVQSVSKVGIFSDGFTYPWF